MLSIVAADDEVKLKNGDRLSGKVVGLAGGKLNMVTPETGPVSLDWTQIVSIKTDAPIKLKLATGEWLEGKVSPGAEGKIKVESAGTVAPVEVEYPKVMSINEPPVSWHGKLSASAKATDGNTHTQSFLIAGEASRETELDILSAKALFRYSKTGAVLTERNSYGIGKYQYKLTPTFYGYVSEELLSDTFKDLSLESITSVGVGYVFVKTGGDRLLRGSGFGVLRQQLQCGERRVAHGRPRRHLPARRSAARIEFKDNFTIYPNFKHSQDFQLRNEATLGTALGSGWDLLGGVITEYDKTPSPGLRSTDDTYFVGLGYTF